MNPYTFDSSDEEHDLRYFQRVTADKPKQNDDKAIHRLTRGELVITDKTLKVLIPHIYVENQTETNKKKQQFVRPAKQIPFSLILWNTPDGRNLLQALHDTAEELKLLTHSAGYILYVVDEIRNEIYICSKSLAETNGKRYSWKLNEAQTIAVYVAKEKIAVIVNDNSTDIRFMDGQDLGHFSTSSILTVPVQENGVCLAILEFYRTNGIPYDNQKELIVAAFLADLAGEVIAENRNIVITQKNQEVNDSLLNGMVQRLIDDHDESELFTIQKFFLNYSRRIFDSESVTYFSFNDENKLERMYTSDKNPVSTLSSKMQQLRYGKEIDMADIITQSRTIVNFVDVFADPRFDNELDYRIGLFIRTVLACEIFTKKNKRFGILMAVNKLSEPKFTKFDEKFLHVFSKYLSIGLVSMESSWDYLKRKKGNVALEDVLFYQITKRDSFPEIYNLEETIYIPENFDEFSFVPNDPNMTQIPKYLFYMFHNMYQTLLPDKHILYKFIFAAKKIYRNNPFHNFYHAFKCTHHIYLIFKNHPTEFSEVEKLAMMLAALLHDSDHRALSPQYLDLIGHPIINKSVATPLEMHHYTFGRCLIEMTKLLTHLQLEQQTTFYKIFKECIISTNLAIYLRQRVELKFLLATDAFDFNNPLHRSYLRSTIMASADFSGEAKTPEYAMKCAGNLYKEYLNEGDLMRRRNLKPKSIMDRTNMTEFPKHEVEFVTSLALPCYEMLNKVLPKTSVLHNQCNQVLNMWKKLVATSGVIKTDSDITDLTDNSVELENFIEKN